MRVALGTQLPLLVGKKRVWTDAEGVVSTVVDVIFNPCVLRRCQLNDESGGFDSTYFRNHLATVAKKFVEQDTGLTLSARFIVLKRARYKGGAEEGDNRALPFELPQELQHISGNSRVELRFDITCFKNTSAAHVPRYESESRDLIIDVIVTLEMW